jgi:hypothetical protein
MSALPHSSPRLSVQSQRRPYRHRHSQYRWADCLQGIADTSHRSDSSENGDAYRPAAIHRPPEQDKTHVCTKHFDAHDVVEVDIADQACVDIFDCFHFHFRISHFTERGDFAQDARYCASVICWVDLRRLDPPVATTPRCRPGVVSAHSFVCQKNDFGDGVSLSTPPTIGGLT